jgi:hypothetical protein
VNTGESGAARGIVAEAPPAHRMGARGLGRGLEAEAATEAGHQVGQLAAFLFVEQLVGEALLELLHAGCGV